MPFGQAFDSDSDLRLTDLSADETPLLVVGWREWVSLPELGIDRIKAKVDSGARSSSLHAFEVEPFQQDGREYVRFKVYPKQRSTENIIECTAPVFDRRSVRSSSGESSDRFVILTSVQWMGDQWQIEMTLADRSEMGFRMLLGRQAMRGRLLIDPSRSYFGGKPVKRKSPEEK